MPGNVNEFLSHVHAEKPIPTAAGAIVHQNAEILDVSDDMLLYELDREIGVEQTAATAEADVAQFQSREPERRERRLSFGIDLPIGVKSQDWFLVSNSDIGKLYKKFYFSILLKFCFSIVFRFRAA